MLSIQGRHVREASIVVTGQVGSALAALAAVKLLTVFLPPDHYGYTAVVTSYVVAVVTVLAAPVTGAGMVSFHEAVREGRSRELMGTLFFITLATLVLPLIGLAARRPLEALDRTNSFGGLILYGVLYLAAELVKAPVLSITAAARWRGAFGSLTLLEGCGKVLLVAAAAGWTTLSARVVIIAYALNGLLVALLGWIFIFRSLPQGEDPDHPFFSRQFARVTIRNGWFFAGIGAASWLITLSDRVLLSTMVPAHDVGIYVAGCQASSILPLGFSSLVMAFMSPILLQKQAADPAQAAHLLGRVVVFIAWLLLPVTVVVLAERDLLLRILTSGRYAASGPVVLWVAPALACLGVTTVTTTGFWMSKRINEYFYIALCAGVLNVIINLLLVPRIGFIAAAISTFITYLVQLSATVAVGRRYIPWRIGVGETAGICAGAVALLVTFTAFAGRMPLLEMVVAVVSYGVISIAVFLLLDEEGRHTAAAAVARLRRFREGWG